MKATESIGLYLTDAEARMIFLSVHIANAVANRDAESTAQFIGKLAVEVQHISMPEMEQFSKKVNSLSAACGCDDCRKRKGTANTSSRFDPRLN